MLITTAKQLVSLLNATLSQKFEVFEEVAPYNEPADHYEVRVLYRPTGLSEPCREFLLKDERNLKLFSITEVGLGTSRIGYKKLRTGINPLDLTDFFKSIRK